MINDSSFFLYFRIKKSNFQIFFKVKSFQEKIKLHFLLVGHVDLSWTKKFAIFISDIFTYFLVYLTDTNCYF
jgi:hypothetical protein